MIGKFILVDNTQAVAADSGVAHQRMRVGDYLRLQFLKLFICTRIARIYTDRTLFMAIISRYNRFREIRGIRVRIISRKIRVRLNDVVEIHEAQSCELLDILLSLASLESTGNGEERALGLERLAASLAIGGGECLELLIGEDEVGYSFKQARKRKLGGHVFENANVHFYRIVSCLT